jgi:hypothetical protein
MNDLHRGCDNLRIDADYEGTVRILASQEQVYRLDDLSHLRRGASVEIVDENDCRFLVRRQ